MWAWYVCILARPPPPTDTGVFLERKGQLLREAPSCPFGRRVVPVPASGVAILRGPIPRPSTFILPRSEPALTRHPLTLQSS